jgi:6-pyruvoyltetrahydropterin/6-carboxytetrahydropterin synthase
MSKFLSTKTYGNDRGLSCCFRQWRSNHSHCSLLHGYSIGVKVIFECDTLDERNWVMDFGGLKEFKAWLEYMFDHTTLIAKDDPFLNTFIALSELTLQEGSSIVEEGRVVDLRIVDAVGCERFSELAFNKMQSIIDEQKEKGTLLNDTVRVQSVEVFEHSANSAVYQR